VFGANDRTAMGARKALSHLEAPLYCGIDGLPGENGGIQLVRDSLLDASYIYPTHGDQIIELAVNILEGKTYEKETMLMSALVTRDNAKVLLMQGEELMRQAAQLDMLHEKADSYLHKLDAQRVANWLSIGVILLLVVVFVLFYLYHLRKISMQRERVVNTLWNMEITPEVHATSPEDDTTAPVEESNQDSVAETPADEQPDEAPSGAVGGAFISRFREVVESRLDNSDLSVDDLAADMNLSRVQLYRKVKAVTGSSPVELLRTARLNRAYQLLLTTDKSVSEVAYAVGFTAPSYFTKCFKEEYGMVPGDVRK
jgi:AraC-like DNA-binding protein